MTGSAHVSRTRPFYAARADTYDLLVVDPVEPWVEAVGAQVDHHGGPGARTRLLDAGCGTGRHAAAFVAAGWDVELVDASPALVDIAARRCPGSTIRVADLTTLAPTGAFDVVTCRGVLNDLLDDDERRAAVTSLAGQLRPGAVLVLDVREHEASRARATGIPRHRSVDLPDGGVLVFTSSTTWSGDRLVVRETHDLRRHGDRERHDHEFRMRPWHHTELREALSAAGLGAVTVRPGVGRATADRVLVTARREPFPR